MKRTFSALVISGALLCTLAGTTDSNSNKKTLTMKFKNLAYLLLAFCTTTTFAACNELDGDNSDFDFGHSAGAAENPYKDGYGRLPN